MGPGAALDSFGEDKKFPAPVRRIILHSVVTKQCLRLEMDSGGLGQSYGWFLNTVLKLQVTKRLGTRSDNKTISYARTLFYSLRQRHVNESAKRISNDN